MSSAGGGDANNGGGKPHAIPVPVLQDGQQTWFGRAIAWLKGEVSSGIAALTDFVQHEAIPFLTPYFKQTALDEIALIKGIVADTAKEIVPDVSLLFSEPGKFMGALTAVVDSSWQKLEANGISVAETSVITASQAALHNIISEASS